MSFVCEFGSERIEYFDRYTGAHVTQITSFPTVSYHFYIEHPSFTEDDSTLVLISQKAARRSAPWALFACDADGLHLRQLTDEDDADNFAVACGEQAAWYQCGTTLRKVDLLSGERTEVCKGPAGIDPMHYWCGCVSRDGNYYFGYGRRKKDGWGVVIRYNTDASESVVLVADPNLCHVHASPGGHGISYGGVDARGNGVQHLMDYDGGNRRVLPTADLSHFTWVGKERRYLGCGMWGRRIMHTRDDVPYDGGALPESTIIVEGSFFWHSGLSYQADWTVADTNWPNEGIMVVNIPARQYTRLCHPENTCGHPQWAHVHPAYNHAGTKVVYTSDRTGICQVYVADVPAEMRERLRTPQPDAAPGGRLPDVPRGV